MIATFTQSMFIIRHMVFKIYITRCGIPFLFIDITNSILPYSCYTNIYLSFMKLDVHKNYKVHFVIDIV